VGDPIEGQTPLEYACTPFTPDGVTGDLALDLRYEQRWFFQAAVRAALSASVALAPGETLSLSVRNTQRKQFDQQTVDEVERSEQTESTIADKDVLNVTRSSSKTNSWNVSGNASIGLPKFSAGLSGSVSQTVNQASSSSAQRTRDSTRKSAQNLKTLQKVQVRQFEEVTAETASTRKITNPYRDRSLRLDVYELAKQYCVEFHLAEVAPVLVFDLDELAFDRRFVLINAGFLSDELIDRLLELELAQALQVTTDLRLEGVDARAQSVALMALDYLFAGPVMFNFPVVPSWNENDPASSFLEPFADWSGLYDAAANRVAVTFSTLAFYYQLYTQEVLPPPADGRMAIELAMSLDQVLAPRWTGVEESEQIRNVIDASDATEVLRRLGGFLTMTGGILRPLLEPAEAEREARAAAERAEFVLARVVDHLRCHSRYYTQRFLHYMANRTQNRAVFKLVEDVIADHLFGMPASLVTAFDAEAAFLDANRVVVPMRVAPTPAELDGLLKELDHGAPKLPLGQLDTQVLTVPTDGVHIEPVAGACLLADISPEPIAGPIHVAVESQA
jgi:hypothetical protein